MHSLLPALLCALTLSAAAQTPLENSLETRLQLDLKVPDAALKAYLPDGFTSSVAAQGPAKDCNLRLIFTDRITINAPDGKPVGKGSNRVAYLIAPVKDPSGANAQLIIGGLTEDPADAPGPFANLIPATRAEVRRTTIPPTRPRHRQPGTWIFEAKSGEHLARHLKFEPGPAARSKPPDAKFYSAKIPAYFQLSHQEQVLDILRNTTTNPPDRVKDFSIKLSGGSYAKLFDGTEKVLSWDHILWIDRAISIRAIKSGQQQQPALQTRRISRRSRRNIQLAAPALQTEAASPTQTPPPYSAPVSPRPVRSRPAATASPPASESEKSSAGCHPSPAVPPQSHTPPADCPESLQSKKYP